MEENVVKTGGTSSISFGSLCWITWLVFLILKLTNVLPETFTWFWVWFPFWLPFALFGAIFVIVAIVAFLYIALSGLE